MRLTSIHNEPIMGQTDIPFPSSETGRRILVCNDLAGLIRTDYGDFRFSEWRWKRMEQPGSNEGKTGEYKRECAAKEQARERDIGANYMRQRHGLVQEKKSAYRPVGGKSYRSGK